MRPHTMPWESATGNDEDNWTSWLQSSRFWAELFIDFLEKCEIVGGGVYGFGSDTADALTINKDISEAFARLSGIDCNRTTATPTEFPRGFQSGGGHIDAIFTQLFNGVEWAAFLAIAEVQPEYGFSDVQVFYTEGAEDRLDLQSALNAAGLPNGFRRATEMRFIDGEMVPGTLDEDGDFVAGFEYDPFYFVTSRRVGDLVGPWIAEDLFNLLDAMKTISVSALSVCYPNGGNGGYSPSNLIKTLGGMKGVDGQFLFREDSDFPLDQQSGPYVFARFVEGLDQLDKNIPRHLGFHAQSAELDNPTNFPLLHRGIFTSDFIGRWSERLAPYNFYSDPVAESEGKLPPKNDDEWLYDTGGPILSQNYYREYAGATDKTYLALCQYYPSNPAYLIIMDTERGKLQNPDAPPEELFTPTLTETTSWSFDFGDIDRFYDKVPYAPAYLSSGGQPATIFYKAVGFGVSVSPPATADFDAQSATLTSSSNRQDVALFQYELFAVPNWTFEVDYRETTPIPLRVVYENGGGAQNWVVSDIK